MRVYLCENCKMVDPGADPPKTIFISSADRSPSAGWLSVREHASEGDTTVSHFCSTRCVAVYFDQMLKIAEIEAG